MISQANQYWGSIYDIMAGVKAKHHYVLGAGQMVAVGEPYGDVIAIPDNGDAAFQELISSYETEHTDLEWYDPVLGQATLIHGIGSGHPIIAECQGKEVALFVPHTEILCNPLGLKPLGDVPKQ